MTCLRVLQCLQVCPTNRFIMNITGASFTRPDVSRVRFLSSEPTVLQDRAYLRHHGQYAASCGRLAVPAYYSGVERGIKDVSLVNIEKIAKGLKKSLPELFGRV